MIKQQPTLSYPNMFKRKPSPIPTANNNQSTTSLLAVPGNTFTTRRASEGTTTTTSSTKKGYTFNNVGAKLKERTSSLGLFDKGKVNGREREKKVSTGSEEGFCFIGDEPEELNVSVGSSEASVDNSRSMR